MTDNFYNNEEVSKTEENEINNTVEEGANVVEAQSITIPKTVPTNSKGTNKGLKVFCIILSAVIVLSCFSLGGYFMGKYASKTPSNNKSNVDISLQSKPSDAKQLSFDSIYENVTKSIVGIFVYNSEGKTGEATGVIYSQDGYIITNDHIYSKIPSAKFKVYLSDGSEYDAHYVAGDTRSDLAVLKINDDVRLSVPEFGNSDDIVSGESVCAIGCPNGYASKPTITVGIVSAPRVRMSITTTYSTNFIQTDAAINPGNSGGALVNMYGQIIGITSSKISGDGIEGVGFAIPTATVKNVAESLVENGNVKNRARLGISYNFINSAMAELNNMSSYGLLVREVSNDSDLYGKIKEGDIITRVNDIPITDDAIILDLLEQYKPSDKIMLTVVNTSGKTVNISAVLLNDEGTSSYIHSDNSSGNSNNNEEFNWPEGF